MAKKKKHPEHENLERWLISYADFITLLFATFVVLYALSQVDIKDFKALEESIKRAFDSPSIMQGSPGVLKDTSNSLFDTSQADSMITPLMMEYLSQRYEEQAMGEIERKINQEVKLGEIEGVEALKTDRGLLVRFKDDYLFDSGSAAIKKDAKSKLDKIGVLIAKKFVLHNMRIEGHTDNLPIKSNIYPSNWELSSARASTIVRYFIERFKFVPSLFSAIGFADTRPIGNNKTAKGRAENRRVEVLILKNKFKSQEYALNEILKMSKEEQEKLQAQRLDTINRIDSISDMTQKSINRDKQNKEKEIILNRMYDKEIKRLSKETNVLDNQTRSKITGQGDWLKPPAKIEDIKPFKY